MSFSFPVSSRLWICIQTLNKTDIIVEIECLWLYSNQSTLYLFSLLVIFFWSSNLYRILLFSIILSHSILSYFQRLPLLVIWILFPLVIKSLSDPLPHLFSKSCLKMYRGFHNILVVSSIFHQNFMQSTMVWFCDLVSLLSTDTWCCFSNWRCWSRDKFHTFTMRQLSHNGTQPSSPSQSPKSSPSSSPKSHPQDHLHSEK